MCTKASPYKFNICDVLDATGLRNQYVVRREDESTIDMDCPFCKGKFKPGKLHIEKARDVFSCLRCGCSGGVVELYKKITLCDGKTAILEMNKYIENGITYSCEECKPVTVYKSEKSQRAPFDVIDKTYRRFLSLCTLDSKHRDNLIKRGLTDEQIKKFGFRTVPTHREQHKKIISKLLLENHTLEGIPGFFIDKKGNWNFNLFRFAEGFLIPIMSVDRKIRGFQIRLDNPQEGKGKYIWLSSANKDKGLGSGSPVHLTNPIQIGATKTIFLTEGALKADIAHCYSGMTFIAVAGVNVQRNLPKYLAYLKKLGVERIVDCFDSDSETNENVEKARLSLSRKVLDSGLKYSRMIWDTQYKGIDDYLTAVPKERWNFTVIET